MSWLARAVGTDHDNGAGSQRAVDAEKNQPEAWSEAEIREGLAL